MDSGSNQEESKTSIRFHYNHDQLIVDTTPYEQKSSARNSATTPTTMNRKRPLSQGRKITSLPKNRPSVGQEFVLKSRLSVGAIFAGGKQTYEASLLEKISTQKSQIESLKKDLKHEEKLVKTLMSNPDNYYIGKYAEEAKAWKNKVSENKKEIKHMELEINELKKNKGVSKVCELKEEIGILSKICRNLEAQLAEKTSDAKSMHEEEKKVKLKIKDYENEIDALKAQNKEIINKYLEKDSIISELKKEVEKLSKKKLAKRNQALKKEVERLKLRLEGNRFAVANSIEKDVKIIDIQKPHIIDRNKIEKTLIIADIKGTKFNRNQIQTELLIPNIESAIKKNPKNQVSILNTGIEPVHKSAKLDQEYETVYNSIPNNRILNSEVNCNPISISNGTTEFKQALDSDIQKIPNENLIKPEDLSVQFEHFSLCMANFGLTKSEVPEYLFKESFEDEMTKDGLIDHLKKFDIILKMPKHEEFCKFLIEPNLGDFCGQSFPNKKTVSQICAKLMANLSDWEIIKDNEEENFDQIIYSDLCENLLEFKKICKSWDKDNSACVSLNQIEQVFIKFLKNPSAKLLYYIKFFCFSLLHRIDAIPYINVCNIIQNLGKKKSKSETLSTPSQIEDNRSNKSVERGKSPIEEEFVAENFGHTESMSEEAADIDMLHPNELPRNETLVSTCIEGNIEIKEDKVFEENKSDLSSIDNPSESHESDQEILEEDMNQEVNEELEETESIEKTQEITESETEFQHEELNNLVIQSCGHTNEVSSKRKKEKDEYEIISNTEIERPLTSFEESSESEEETFRAEEETHKAEDEEEEEEEYNIA
ncbi:unnamed protein product [Blepharisma stoltei]|uniref:EF-hand domain-containing protein n=1 Tax=Blepharisma stoltei TaxID=1481888 RepID=A0AAU9JH02_9CILI|nr:unnamed protein product [Blepharisma stoltei]